MATAVIAPTRARGAEAWVTAGTVGAAALNYAFTLLLTLLLSGDDFAIFAAGQALLLVAGTVAAAGVPWVLAQAIARNGLDPRRPFVPAALRVHRQRAAGHRRRRDPRGAGPELRRRRGDRGARRRDGLRLPLDGRRRLGPGPRALPPVGRARDRRGRRQGRARRRPRPARRRTGRGDLRRLRWRLRRPAGRDRRDAHRSRRDAAAPPARRARARDRGHGVGPDAGHRCGRRRPGAGGRAAGRRPARRGLHAGCDARSRAALPRPRALDRGFPGAQPRPGRRPTRRRQPADTAADVSPGARDRRDCARGDPARGAPGGLRRGLALPALHGAPAGRRSPSPRCWSAG